MSALRRQGSPVGVAGCLSLAAMVCCAQPPPLPAIEARPIPEARPEPCVGADYDMITSGTTFRWDGSPAPGVPIAERGPPGVAPKILTRSGPDGTWQTTLSGPHELYAPGVGRVPRSTCVGIPTHVRIQVPDGSRVRMHVRETNFVTDPICPVHIEAPAWSGTGRLLVDRVTEVLILDELQPAAAIDTTIPCDARAVGVETEAGLLGGACARGLACLEDGRASLSAPRAAPARVETGLPHVLLDTPWGLRRADDAGAAVIPWDGRPFNLLLTSEGHAPRRVRVTAATTVVSLRPAVAVEVRCVGQPDDRCPAPPVMRYDGDEAPCRWVSGFGAVCDVPADVPTRIGDAGVWTDVQLSQGGQAVVSLDHRSFTGVIEGDVAAPACDVLAVRQPGLIERWFGAWIDRPRTRVARTTCDERGHYELVGLSSGDWSLHVDPVPGPPVESTVHTTP